MEKEILLKILLDSKDAVKASSEAEIELRKLKATKKDLDKAFDTAVLKNDTTAMKALSTQVTETAAKMEFYKNVVRDSQREIKSQTTINQENDGSLNQLKATILLLTQQYDKLTGEQLANENIGGKLAKTIKGLSDELKTNKTAIGDNRLNVGNYKEDMIAALKELNLTNQAIEENTQQLQQQRKSIADIFNPTKAQTEQLNKINASIEQNNEKFKANSELIHTVTNSLGVMEAQSKDTGGSMGFLKDKMDANGKVIVTYANNVGGLKQKMADLQQQLKNPDLSLDQYRELNDSLKDTKLKLDQASGAVDEFGRREPKNKIKRNMDDTAEATAALSQSIGLLTIAFGNNENASKFQEKALKAIAVSTTIANIAKARFAILDTIQLVRTKAATIAQNLYTAAIGKGTTAAKLFRGALAATGIGAVVILLGELIFNFDKVAGIINRGTNTVRDFASEMSGGNKVVKGFVELILFLVSPLATIIRLISDFSGTVRGLENGIKDASNWVKEITSDIPILGSVVEVVVGQIQSAVDTFDRFATSMGLMTKKFKPTMEQLSKTYENFTYDLEKNTQGLKDQIKMAQAQGKSEQQVAALTKKLLQQTTIERQKALDFAIEVQQKLIKQNGKLNDEQQKLFDNIKKDFDQAALEEAAFNAERNKAAVDAARERLGIEQDLQARLNDLFNSAIKDEFERRQAQLDEQYRLDVQANEERVKELKRTGMLTKKIKDQLNTELILLDQKYSQDQREIDQDRLKKEEEARKEANAIKEQAIKDSYSFQAAELEKAFMNEEKLQQANFQITAQTEQGKTQQLRREQLRRLEASMQYYQDQLALRKKFALEDGKLDDAEVQGIQELQDEIKRLLNQIAKAKGEPTIPEDLGIDQETLDKINFTIGSITQGLQLAGDISSAIYEQRKSDLDSTFDAEEENIKNSSKSQKQKDKELEKLNQKRAMAQYNLEVEQFNVSKGMQIVNGIITGIQAALNAYTSALAIPFIGAAIAPAAAAVAGTFAAGQVAIIAAQEPPKPPKFAGGGFTGDGMYYDETGHKVAGVVHDNEWVGAKWMVKHPVYGRQIKNLDRIQKRGFADGGYTSRDIAGSMGTDAALVNSVALKVADAIASNPPIVTVSAIDNVKSKRTKVQVAATR